MMHFVVVRSVKNKYRFVNRNVNIPCISVFPRVFLKDPEEKPNSPPPLGIRLSGNFISLPVGNHNCSPEVVRLFHDLKNQLPQD